MNNSLNGINILVTRAEHQTAELNHLIQQFGGCPINLPLQKVIHSQNSLIEMEKLVEEAEWILFTSVNSVHYFVQKATKELVVRINLKNIGAVGEKTKHLLEKNGLKVSFIPSKYTGNTFATEISKKVKSETNFLFIRGSLASDTVPSILKKNGHRLSMLTVYETVPNFSVKDELIQLLLEKKLHIITFLNPFSVRQFCNLIDNNIKISELENIKIACIGEVTASEAKQKGFKNILVPNQYTIESLLQKIVDDLKN